MTEEQHDYEPGEWHRNNVILINWEIIAILISYWSRIIDDNPFDLWSDLNIDPFSIQIMKQNIKSKIHWNKIRYLIHKIWIK